MNRTVLLVALVLVAGCESADETPGAVGQLASVRVELRADANEILAARPLPEGSHVEADALIAQQHQQRALLAIQQADAELRAREAILTELTNGTRPEQLAAARADAAGAADDLAFRQDELDRQRRLRERGLASAGDLDAARAAFDQAKSAAAATAARLRELANGTRAETLARAEADVDAARASAAARRLDLERLSLRAPGPAIIDRYAAEIGERLNAGELVAVLLVGTQPRARVYVPAQYRATLASGDSVNVAVDGIAESIRGRVEWIARDAAFTPYFALNERDRSRLSFLAEMSLDYTGERLPDGLPVTVEWPAQ